MVTLPYINVQPLNFVLLNMVVNPWGEAWGPLNLGGNLRDLPKGYRDVLWRFNSDGKVAIKDHLSVFHSVYRIVDVSTKDVVVRLFVQTLTKVAPK